MGELMDAVAREGVRSVERIVPGDPIPYEGPLAKPQARTRRVMARVLQYLAEHERPDGPFAIVSRHVLQCELGITPGRLRNVLYTLVRCGYVRVIACFREDGGQRESAYQITDEGRAFLRTYLHENMLPPSEALG